MIIEGTMIMKLIPITYNENQDFEYDDRLRYTNTRTERFMINPMSRDLPVVDNNCDNFNELKVCSDSVTI